jgi:hypothetical protein
LEVLAVEQNLARKLVKSLSDEQRTLAIIAEKAPRDIITSQNRKTNKGAFLPQQGIKFHQLDPYGNRMPVTGVVSTAWESSSASFVVDTLSYL